MKKFLAVLMSLLIVSGCAPKKVESDKISVVTTLFPQYDFAREIAGDKAEITLLLPPGVESHSFEPSPADMIKINECDIFIYTGENMEPWAEKLINSGDMKGSAWNGASNIVLKEYGGDIDPHVWTDPQNAIVMAQNVLRALVWADNENSDYYYKNFEEYSAKLKKLDNDFADAVKNSPVKKMAFGTKFSIHYFADRYGLSHISAFDFCGHEGEPSAKVLADIVDTVKNERLPAVFYGELESTKAAETIAAEAGVKTLLFHSCHNVTKEEFERGETYLSLMEKNLEVLKEGLGND